MLITYAVNNTIIIALDKKVQHLIVKIYNQNKNELANFEFFKTDFAYIDFQTNETKLFLVLVLDVKKEQRRIFF